MCSSDLVDTGISTITDAYKLSEDADVYEIWKEVHTKLKINSAKAICVIEDVRNAFSQYWEIWGNKQVFINDKNSFFISLKLTSNIVL